MGKRQSRFDSAFRLQAVELVKRSSRPRYQVAAELGVSDTTLGKWMNESEMNGPEPSLTVSERPELEQLRVEKREWVVEREILKKSDGLLGEGVERVSLYRFIDAQKVRFEIRALCKALSVPESSYYDWDHHGRAIAQARAGRDAALVERIRVVHDASTGTYGSPRVTDELRDDAVMVSKRKVAELMAANGIVGVTGREHTTVTTRRDRMQAPFPDLLQRNFQPDAPDVAWYGDVTYIWVDNKFWYLATVLDACTKEVLGWCFADHMRTELVATALKRAVARRGTIPKDLIFHTDRGSQYTSDEFGRLCRSFNIRQSMGRRATCFDNAAAESFFATLKRELVNRYIWNSADQLHNGIFTWIETWYNRRRRHSTIGYLTPVQANTIYRQHRKTA